MASVSRDVAPLTLSQVNYPQYLCLGFLAFAFFFRRAYLKIAYLILHVTPLITRLGVHSIVSQRINGINLSRRGMRV